MNRKLSDYASIAEIVSGIAVVITLVFLTLSLRDNTNTTRTLVYQQLLGAINEHNIAVMQDEESAKLWVGRYQRDISELSEGERARLVTMFRIIYRTRDAAYYAGRYGTLGASERGRFERVSCDSHRQLNVELREEVLAVVSDEFREFLESSCE